MKKKNINYIYAVLYTIVTLYIFYLGYAKNELFYVLAIVMALVSLYWIKKAWSG